MKKTSTLILILIAAVLSNTKAQTIYTISSNKNWNGNYPGYVSNATFNISAGVTLTIDKNNVTCYQCTFNGGKISIQQDISFQSSSFNNDSISANNKIISLQSSTVAFSNVYFNLTGNSTISGNAPITMTNSKFVFNNTARFNPTYQLEMLNSSLYFNGNSNMTATGTPVNLKNNSQIIIGDGSNTSTAFVHINGPALNIYGTSAITLANKNNYYRNWSNYTYHPTSGPSVSFPTTNNNLNCGGSNPNGCTAPNAYGPATLNLAGLMATSILPVKLLDFTAGITNNSQVKLSWSTENEINFSEFVIERNSDNNQQWQTIGRISAKASNSGIANYEITDAMPVKGTNYYRLKMIDKDGSISYSKTINLKSEQTASVAIVTTGKNSITIKVPTSNSRTLSVFSYQGQLLYRTNLSGQMVYNVQLPSNATQGILVAQVMSNGETKTISFLNK